MSGENRVDKFEKVVRLLTVLLTFSLVIIGIWYTIETRNLRIQAQNQLDVFKKQFQLSNIPSLIPSIIHKDKVKELIMEDKIVLSDPEINYSKENKSKILKYVLFLENISDNIAYDVSAYIFDSETKSYLRSFLAKAFVKPKVHKTIPFVAEKTAYIDEKQLIKEVNELYDLNIDSLDHYIKQKTANIIFLIFNDIQGNTYLRIRAFYYDKQNIRRQGRTILHELSQIE